MCAVRARACVFARACVRTCARARVRESTFGESVLPRHYFLQAVPPVCLGRQQRAQNVEDVVLTKASNPHEHGGVPQTQQFEAAQHNNHQHHDINNHIQRHKNHTPFLRFDAGDFEVLLADPRCVRVLLVGYASKMESGHRADAHHRSCQHKHSVAAGRWFSACPTSSANPQLGPVGKTNFSCLVRRG
jgi:hypothetical protein